MWHWTATTVLALGSQVPLGLSLWSGVGLGGCLLLQVFPWGLGLSLASVTLSYKFGVSRHASVATLDGLSFASLCSSHRRSFPFGLLRRLIVLFGVRFLHPPSCCFLSFALLYSPRHRCFLVGLLHRLIVLFGVLFASSAAVLFGSSAHRALGMVSLLVVADLMYSLAFLLQLLEDLLCSLVLPILDVLCCLWLKFGCGFRLLFLLVHRPLFFFSS